MLLKIDCEPKITVSLSLSFDDGTVKELDIKKGMYGTFKYLQHGAVNTVSGEVVDVSVATYSKKPAAVSEPAGYLCDPNYINTGVIDTRPVPNRRKTPVQRPPRHPEVVDSVERRNKFMIKVLTTYAQIVTITSDTILDVEVLYTDSKPIMSPDDSNRIRLMKVEDGNLLVSMDGIDWITVSTDGSSSTEFTALKTLVNQLRAAVESFHGRLDDFIKDNTDNSTSGGDSSNGDDSNNSSGGDNSTTDGDNYDEFTDDELEDLFNGVVKDRDDTSSGDDNSGEDNSGSDNESGEDEANNN
jgi:hypothetical protein